MKSPLLKTIGIIIFLLTILLVSCEVGGYGVPQTSYKIINNPAGIATDKAGNIYFTNNFNSNVLKVSTNGKITEIAGTSTVHGCDGDGGLALKAHLWSPDGIAVDASNNIYFSDLQCSLVHKINATNGYLYAVAGNGNGGYSGDGGQATATSISPGNIALDTLGNLYIVDQLDNRIREVNLSSGIITTIAGNGTAGFSGDGGQATAAELNNPFPIALDDSNNIYIGDYKNYRIRKINAITHIITTIAGTGVAGYNGDGIPATSAEVEPGSLATDKSRNIYFSDGSRVRKITTQTGIITTITNIGGGIAFDPSFANLYIASNDAILKLNIATGSIATVVSN